MFEDKIDIFIDVFLDLALDDYVSAMNKAKKGEKIFLKDWNYSPAYVQEEIETFFYDVFDERNADRIIDALKSGRKVDRRHYVNTV